MGGGGRRRDWNHGRVDPQQKGVQKVESKTKKFQEKPQRSMPKLIIPEEQRKIRNERVKKYWDEKKNLAKNFKFHAVRSWK